ncbi:sensor histidine kinase [Glaciimonas immobilis]|uniref:Two-component system NarL family sensor kinase n=1 Tax=Glaciimonas immobilis TaxID=728004 RepID=A0A840RW84_9BURK|nr:ATP-binding protein [Glaciimonas immobilis]KAF3996024.1 PAS domain S-box protein [Glaciimonas immobilis]MBB5201853.1 two-component system NarL family sensor kinase [Glaciimonas immobilis]
MLKLQQVMMTMRGMSSELELSKSQFGELTELIGIASIIVDSQSRILSINEIAAAMLGFKVEELQDTLLAQLVENGQGGLDQILTFPLKSGKLESFEILFIGRSGRKSTLTIVPQSIEHSDGITRSMLLLLTEKTNRNALLQTLDRSAPKLQQFSNRLIAAHELELKRVSSELHDGIGQVLAMIKFMIEDAARQVKSGKSDEGEKILDETVVRLREAMNEVRRISIELRPSSLDDLGLIPTIQWHCRIYRKAYQNMRLNLDLDVIEAEVPEVLKLDIFRIIQEALNNVAKHAQASQVTVSLHVEHANMRLIIRDNGQGFDANPRDFSSATRWGLGLKSMRERVESSAGNFWIQSGLNSGTRLEARWSLQAIVSEVLV